MLFTLEPFVFSSLGRDCASYQSQIARRVGWERNVTITFHLIEIILLLFWFLTMKQFAD